MGLVRVALQACYCHFPGWQTNGVKGDSELLTQLLTPPCRVGMCHGCSFQKYHLIAFALFIALDEY